MGTSLRNYMLCDRHTMHPLVFCYVTYTRVGAVDFTYIWTATRGRNGHYLRHYLSAVVSHRAQRSPAVGVSRNHVLRNTDTRTVNCA